MIPAFQFEILRRCPGRPLWYKAGEFFMGFHVKIARICVYVCVFLFFVGDVGGVGVKENGILLFFFVNVVR